MTTLLKQTAQAAAIAYLALATATASPAADRPNILLDAQAPMLPRQLQQAGYATYHFGKWHVTSRDIPDAPHPTIFIIFKFHSTCAHHPCYYL